MARKTSESVRIIGGKWRSRQLTFTPTEGLRPTGNRIRETLFNWLAPYIEGASCLDLFSGSGS
ncbi:MAG: RsmD family RNA methyltransferase, partial [Porticoccaceae bacterium]